MEVQLLSERFARAHHGASIMPLTDQQQTLLGAFAAGLAEGDLRLVTGVCPCRLPAAEDIRIAEIDRYGLPLSHVLCRACGTVRIDPYLDEQSLETFYRDYYQDMYGRSNDKPRLLRYQRAHYGDRIAALFAERLGADSAVLEIGCGTGGATAAFRALGCFTAGCDFSRELVEYGAEQGLTNLWTGKIDDAPAHVAERKYDLIYMFHVLEHIPEPAVLLRSVRNWLKPSGALLAVVPDLARIDVSRNPAGDARKFFHIAHKFNFSEAGLARIAAEAGFGCRRVSPSPHPDEPIDDARDLAEMWIEFGAGMSAAASVHGNVGAKTLSYLQRTEELFLAGKSPAQIAIASRATAARKQSAPASRSPAKRKKWYDRVPLVGLARRCLKAPRQPLQR